MKPYTTPANIIEQYNNYPCLEKSLYTWVDEQKVKQTKFNTCSSKYNCCDCAGNDCGCAYCFSCNACEFCNPEDE